MEIGMQLKTLSPYKKTLMVAHSNGSIGYLRRMTPVKPVVMNHEQQEYNPAPKKAFTRHDQLFIGQTKCKAVFREVT